ncbi:MAG: ethanolamine utilization microcompartment protein EutL [Propionibacteriaceae bacterium]|nr:ethanolamine utilization microcompartment protein EutL [Propionibacteriaceae bacterium]
MAILEPVKPTILATRLIANVDRSLAERMKLAPRHRSLGLLTCDIDDSFYVALDEATKFADVDVVYARSFYAGAAHASGPYSGEVVGMLAGSSPAEVRAGMDACISYAQDQAWFYTADDAGKLTFFAHLISATGSYLSREAGIALGTPMAYLIAPPLEAVYGIDLALKAAEVELREYFEPPSPTNYSGGRLTGTQSACRAACSAFQEAVLAVARGPIEY